MLRQIHITALHRIAVDIVQLLPYHGFAENYFSVGTLLPELIFPVTLVCQLRKSQLRQQALRSARFQQSDEPGSGVRLEVLRHLSKRGACATKCRWFSRIT